ncbi:MAG: type I-U CRISPR-associated helicase/endonuclease Cas3 [Verrucomicrobiota bacterium]|nr:type I-U CRISPR-associated helicase/endonuclease Cas3 [Verrucomicrobiota bacterium]
MNFDSLFEQLTGSTPFPWQRRLYETAILSGWPKCCDIPTGLGKTSIIAIWLIALAKHPEKMPRRLVYVVNRRTVVDQTTTEVEKLRQNIALPALLSELYEPLSKLCASPCDNPLALSTLRGQFADNREWSSDPCRPAVIAGTVDMIGSRLLFSGYGIGFKSRPLHAGFLGQDVLLVHDEAHLEPAFQHLLTAIETKQEKSSGPKKITVLELTATRRSAGVPFALDAQDEAHPEVLKRLNAHKRIYFHPIGDEKKELAESLATLAISRRDSGREVLIFARTVKAVEEVKEFLDKAKIPKCNTEVLTGTLRGYEREQLLKKESFMRFLPSYKKDARDYPTVYLICTSAGEVGVNLSAADLICDLSTFESMGQRFGRVNRFGIHQDSEVHFVHPKDYDTQDATEWDMDKPIEASRVRTLALLRQLDGDASPNALRKLVRKDQNAVLSAFAPIPTLLETSDILFDTWSLTSIQGRLPGRPPVAEYLHGISDEIPQTTIAWRTEVELITGSLTSVYPPEALLEDFPLKPHELLRDNSDRIFEQLKILAKQSGNSPVWIVASDGTINYSNTLEQIASGDKGEIQNCTLILPPCAGGLKDGFLKGAEKSSENYSEDVSCHWPDKENHHRDRLWGDEKPARGMRLIREIDLHVNSDTEVSEEAEDDSSVSDRYWRWYELPKSADAEGSRFASAPVELAVHHQDVARQTDLIMDKLGCFTELRSALLFAARNHDLGKKRDLWQRSIGRPAGETRWLAKSGPGMHPRKVGENYRHEFGSLANSADDATLMAMTEELRDAALHIIAAHHGRARPHFTLDESFDPDYRSQVTRAIAMDTPLRFARLQQRYGRWGLALLESILRAADRAASINPSSTLELKP